METHLTFTDGFVYTMVTRHIEATYWMVYFLFVGATSALVIQSLAMWCRAMTERRKLEYITERERVNGLRND